MNKGYSLLPFFCFLIIFLGAGLYFTYHNVDFAFYQISPTVAILPAIILSILISKRKISTEIDSFTSGICNRDIMTMCIIFILAGAFGSITKSIGCVDDTVQFAISLLPKNALLPGLFLISSFIATAIGTSMGVVAAVTPMAVGLSQITNLPLELSVATVVSGAMFGDNLSLISDTTIAAVQSQHADNKKKFVLNTKIALIASILMLVLLSVIYVPEGEIIKKDYNVIKIMPYILIVILSMCNLHVFTVLMIGIIFSGFVGLLNVDYSPVNLSQDIYKGFASMNEIMVLTILIGGLSHMIRDQGGIDYVIGKIESLIERKRYSKKYIEYLIGALSSVNDILIANNTVAIILSGEVTKKIAEKNHILSHRAACWLDIFSCVFQGILPYSAQILLASSLSGVQPLDIVTKVYYCLILGVVTIIYIPFSKN